MKEGIFIGPQIKQLFEDQALSNEELGIYLETSAETFPRNEKAENYSEIGQELISSCSAVGCNVSLKLSVLHHHLDFFP